ncbi:MAG: sprT domain-containing protein [Bacteroidota bacterium]
MINKREILSKYLPETSVDMVIELLDIHPCYLKIVNNRKTKHGDFRKLPDGSYQITINCGLNPNRFLLTLIHEIAHLVTYKKHKKVKPHGIEWKINFQHLMLPFFKPEIIPSDLMPLLANYLKNPKASTDADTNLSLALKKYDISNGKHIVLELPINTEFKHNNRLFVKGKKRRTRYECIEILTDKKYLFHQNAEVDLVEN